jgi:drug/metabolite transporter (DMT)-like permease
VLFFISSPGKHFGLSFQPAELVSLMKLKSPLQVIIDLQPLTVAVLASLLFGESIGAIGAGGLILDVIGLLLLEVCVLLMRVQKNLYALMWSVDCGVISNLSLGCRS